ncbi:unnamed protein product [Closterium sp. NIES-54]
MALCEVHRSATVAFAPTEPLIAMGTMAGAIDLSFSSSACLEIFRLEFASTTASADNPAASTASSGAGVSPAGTFGNAADVSPDDFFGGLGSPDQSGGKAAGGVPGSAGAGGGRSDLPSLGAATASDRFNRLSWGSCGVEQSEAFSHGIIAGGLIDGTVALWNPARIISGKTGEGEGALVAKMSKHKGAVRGLEFNPAAPNLLASGAEDGELCIWDLANPSAPSLYPSLKGAGGGPQGEISCLAWNRKVQHIVATTSYSGLSVVWDLRKQKQVISFADPVSRRRCSCLQWNPEIATQLIVASDDDRSPSLQVWDLRNAMSPVKELTSHTKGVLAMAWCPTDSGLLLSCAKDNRTLCWDTSVGEVLCELPAGTNWNFDLQWSPRVPGLLSASCFDGHVSLYNIESASSKESDFGASLANRTPMATSRAPKWLKRPCGATFGFGGRLLCFGSKAGQAGAQVAVHSVVTEEAVVARADEFEAAVAGGDRENLKAFCQHKAQLAM